jgi:hypothetical protein
VARAVINALFGCVNPDRAVINALFGCVNPDRAVINALFGCVNPDMAMERSTRIRWGAQLKMTTALQLCRR